MENYENTKFDKLRKNFLMNCTNFINKTIEDKFFRTYKNIKIFDKLGEEFLTNCNNIINEAISKKESSTNITWKSFPDDISLCNVKQVYNYLTVYYFNNGISIGFEGYNDGSSVPITYMNPPDQEILDELKTDKNNCNLKIDLLYTYATEIIKNELNDTQKKEIPLDVGIIYPIVGFMADPVIYFVSKKLKKQTGFKIVAILNCTIEQYGIEYVLRKI